MIEECPMKEPALHLKHLVKPGEKFQLRDVAPDDTTPYKDKKEVQELLAVDRKELVKLQELLYAEGQRSVLIVLQAMDTGGKDGAIAHVMAGVNPQGCVITPFKVPTAEELAHDYLWRVHKVAPPKRMIGIFNRSHYEDVLVVRVHSLVPNQVWSQRYEQINQFEKLLTENGVTLLKFFLHISREEQKKRLLERIEDPTKHWKFSLGDLKERELWDDYMAAYEDAVNLTSTPWAPWYVIPANRKWYRNLVVARVLTETLRGFNMQWPQSAEDLSQVVIPD
jgi:PPK2 family polyphosphate:nucleotide phosphotransferase